MQHNENGKLVTLGTLEQGSVFGLVSEALDVKQEETITAKEECLVYELDYESIILEAGGEEQPISLLLKALIKQYDKQMDSLVDELEDHNSSDNEKNSDSLNPS